MALQEKSITVASAELKKSGTTNGKNWTIYKIVDQDNKKYTTFERELAQLGVPAHIFYEETERDWVNPEGKTIKVKDRTIRKFQIGAEYQTVPTASTFNVKLPGQPSEPKNPSQGNVEARIKALEVRVDALEDNVIADLDTPF